MSGEKCWYQYAAFARTAHVLIAPLIRVCVLRKFTSRRMATGNYKFSVE